MNLNIFFLQFYRDTLEDAPEASANTKDEVVESNPTTVEGMEVTSTPQDTDGVPKTEGKAFFHFLLIFCVKM